MDSNVPMGYKSNVLKPHLIHMWEFLQDLYTAVHPSLWFAWVPLPSSGKTAEPGEFCVCTDL